VDAEADVVDAEANMKKNDIPSLGVGLGFRPEFMSSIFMNREKIDFLEIIADHYIDCSPEKLKELDLLAENFILIPHAIHLSLGSVDLDLNYLHKLNTVIQRINPPYWSEHISFSQVHGIDIGHLSPLPYSREAIDAFCKNIERVKKSISQPLILENISYSIKLPGQEMPEAKFINEILLETGCGLLLDVTNLYTNSVNHNYNALGFLNEVMAERIVQLHFVGVDIKNEVIIDSHSQKTSPEIWSLMEEVFKRSKVKGAVLERDLNFPAFSEITEELDIARKLGKKHKQWN